MRPRNRRDTAAGVPMLAECRSTITAWQRRDTFRRTKSFIRGMRMLGVWLRWCQLRASAAAQDVPSRAHALEAEVLAAMPTQMQIPALFQTFWEVLICIACSGLLANQTGMSHALEMADLPQNCISVKLLNHKHTLNH